jgi:subtilisin family serine protease
VIRVAVLDSGVNDAARHRVLNNADFPPFGQAAPRADGGPRDRLGHGTRVAAVISGVGSAQLLDARIFFDDLRTSAVQAALGIDWLLEQGAQLINMSFGLREDRVALRAACARAAARGVLLVAASPARGAPVFPAAYEGVIRATGDARCAPGQYAWLATTQADFGAHVKAADGGAAGASMGCAHVCAAIADCLARHPGATRETLLATMVAGAAFRGPERRT